MKTLVSLLIYLVFVGCYRDKDNNKNILKIEVGHKKLYTYTFSLEEQINDVNIYTSKDSKWSCLLFYNKLINSLFYIDCKNQQGTVSMSMHCTEFHRLSIKDIHDNTITDFYIWCE